MGIWSAVKYALNSTLGTSSFQPLDYWIKNNNTASSTGTLSQKLSYLINQRQASLTGSGVTVYSRTGNVFGYSNGSLYTAAKFVAPVDGLYKATITIPASVTKIMYVHKIVDVISTHGLYSTSSSDKVGYVNISQDMSYTNSTVGSQSVRHVVTTTEYYWSDYIEDGGGVYKDLVPIIGSAKGDSSSDVTASFMFRCKAGEQVQLVLSSNASSGGYISSISVTYQSR